MEQATKGEPARESFILGRMGPWETPWKALGDALGGLGDAVGDPGEPVGIRWWFPKAPGTSGSFSDMPTWANLGPTWGQLSPPCPNMSQCGPSWGQLDTNMNRKNIEKPLIFLGFFDTFGLWGGSCLPFPLPEALGEVGRRNLHLFFGLSKPHFFHFIFLLLFCFVLAPSWAPFWSVLGAQVGPSSAQVAS